MTNRKQAANKIGLIIPAYNEGAVLGDVIAGLQHTFNKSRLDYLIIVVDDGSKDNTASVARAAGVHVISHILNSGSGGATATGLRYARQVNCTIVATLDADGQHDPADVLEGVNRMLDGKTDLLIGSRLINNEGMSLTKRFGNKGLSFITYLLFGVNVTDSQSGLRIFSKKALNGLHWKTNGYEFCSEMLWRAKQLRLRISEYPIKAIYTDYSRAKGQNNWNAFNIIKSLIRRRLVEFFYE